LRLHDVSWVAKCAQPPERSVDIDTDIDLAFVEFLLERKGIRPDQDSGEIGLPVHQDSMRLTKNIPRMDTIHIDSRKIGWGEPVFIIAEAGVNHNGDLQTAEEMVDVAAEAGADAVKFQTFRADEVVSAAAPKARYQIENTAEQGSQLEMLSSGNRVRVLDTLEHGGRSLLGVWSHPEFEFLRGDSTP
jgi:hypothetical protein